MKLVEKYYSGGVTAIFNPTSFLDIAALTKTQAADKSSTGTSESKSNLEEQMSKYGDFAGKILPSEMGVIQRGIMNAADFESSPEMQGLTKAQQYALMQSKYIQQMSTGLMNYKNLEKAKDHLISSGAAEEIALTSEGYVFVRDGEDINLVPFTKFNPAKHIPITNAELTNLRANDPRFGFNDKVTASLMGATSMKEIREVITQSVAHLGSIDQSSERFLNPFDQSNEGVIDILRGIKITQRDIQTMDLGTLIKQKVKDKNNAQALQHAVAVVLGQLTQQQKALLAIRAKEIGMEADPKALVMEYMYSIANGEHSESLDIVNTFSSGNAELRAKNAEERQIRKEQRAQEAKDKKAQENPLSEEKLPASLRFVVGMAAKDQLEITNGAKGKFIAYGARMPITKDNNPIGLATLDEIEHSDYAGSLDISNATVGGKKIEGYKRTHVLADSGKMIKAALPYVIDPQTKAIKPDLSACSRLDQAWAELEHMGVTKDTPQGLTSDQLAERYQIINAVLQKHQLPLMFIGIDNTGQPIFNIAQYKEFAVMNAYVDGDALPDGAKWEEELMPISGRDQEDLIKQFREKQPGKKYSPPDRYGFFESIAHFGNEADLYKGVIFIPIIDNPNTVLSTAGASYQPQTQQAVALERRYNQMQKPNEYNGNSYTNKARY